MHTLVYLVYKPEPHDAPALKVLHDDWVVNPGARLLTERHDCSALQANAAQPQPGSDSLSQEATSGF